MSTEPHRFYLASAPQIEKGRSVEHFRPGYLQSQLPRQAAANNARDANQTRTQHDQAGRLRNGGCVCIYAAGEGRESVCDFVVGVGVVGAEESRVEELLVADLRADRVKSFQAIAVERTASRIIGILRHHHEPIDSRCEVDVKTHTSHGTNKVGVLVATAAGAASRGHSVGPIAARNQGSTVTFGNATADFPVGGGG